LTLGCRELANAKLSEDLLRSVALLLPEGEDEKCRARRGRSDRCNCPVAGAIHPPHGCRIQDLRDRLFPGFLGVFVKEFEHIGHGAGNDAAMVEAGNFLPLDVKAGCLELLGHGPTVCTQSVLAAGSEV
jgi:hypothetical protein